MFWGFRDLNSCPQATLGVHSRPWIQIPFRMELCRVEGYGHDTKELKNYILNNLLPPTLLNFGIVL